MPPVGGIRQDGIFPYGRGEDLGTVVNGDRTPGENRPYDTISIKIRL